MPRHGMITGLRTEKVDEYKRLHAAAFITGACLPVDGGASIGF